MERYFSIVAGANRVTLRSAEKQKENNVNGKKKKKKIKITKLDSYDSNKRETNSTGFAYTCTLKNNTVALNNSRYQIE